MLHYIYIFFLIKLHFRSQCESRRVASVRQTCCWLSPTSVVNLHQRLVNRIDVRNEGRAAASPFDRMRSLERELSVSLNGGWSGVGLT